MVLGVRHSFNAAALKNPISALPCRPSYTSLPDAARVSSSVRGEMIFA